jgi:general stress protein YciG
MKYLEVQMAENNKGDTSNRGFASMDEDRQRDIARKGGESVPDEKRSFSQDRELASEAGRKGGEASGGNQGGSGNQGGRGGDNEGASGGQGGRGGGSRGAQGGDR